MLRDGEYFNNRISRLEGAGDLGEHIFNVVRAKAVVSDPGGATAKRSSMEKEKEKDKSHMEQEATAPPSATATAPAPAPAGPDST